jgi:uncharacterized cupin superfamily protein
LRRWQTRTCAFPPYDLDVVPEAFLEETENGLVPKGDGWFVVNARRARWHERQGRGFRCSFEGESEFPQLGISVYVLAPGEPIGMYHWEAGQEDFLVLEGDALLIIEGEERPLGRWDFVHCPAGSQHIIVGAGERPCVVLAVGARDRSTGAGWGGYTVNEAALRHGAGVEHETTDASDAYARFLPPEQTRYPDGLLPD